MQTLNTRQQEIKKQWKKSSCVSFSFVTVMTIRESMVRKKTFQSVDNIEVIDEREKHHGLFTDNNIISTLAETLKKQF